MDETLAKKLLIKPGRVALLLNPPAERLASLTPLPAGATLLDEAAVAGTAEAVADVVLAFVAQRADIDRLAPQAMAALKPGGVLWLAYPKRSKSVQTDINRDTGWESVQAAGWLPVTQVAVDETWSALRFRPVAEIKTLTRKM